MDPFNDVKEDAYSTISVLEGLINNSDTITQEVKLDFNNNLQELQEIYKDLQQAIQISESNPESFQLTKDDINQRKYVLQSLESTIQQVKDSWDRKMRYTKREVTTMSNRISQDSDSPENPFSDQYDESMNHFQQQQLIQEQDLHLESIHETMKSLNQQAQLMGSELEEQAIMLDDLDQELENVDNKIQRGLKRIGFVIEKNKERASDWCIGILVFALCILLILVIAL